MSEAENYSALQQAKSELREALENIKKFDEKIGGDGEKGTFNGEVANIIEEVFPNFLDY
jgi:prefoldin subunit 5